MRERAVTPQEQARAIDFKINALKSQLIGLTQQKDILMGNPVARRMIVTVDVVPSVFTEEKRPSSFD